MSTIHRRDITSDELRIVADFTRAIQILSVSNKRLVWDLGEVKMILPVWNLAYAGWRLANYKQFGKKAIGILVPDFRRICRYIRVSESQMINTLYRMSMISLVPGQTISGKLKFKQLFPNIPRELIWLDPAAGRGFIIEQRRAKGNFR